MKLQKKAPQIEAIQFKGGLDSAIEVIGWLHVRDIPASYVPEILNDGEIAIYEHIVVRGGVFAHGSRGFCVGKDVWIVDDPETAVYQVSGKQLFDEYEPIPDVSVTNASDTFKWACPVDGCQFLVESPGFTYLMEAIGTHNGKGVHG